jgi:very-short-patch-repair endonuclease
VRAKRSPLPLGEGQGEGLRDPAIDFRDNEARVTLLARCRELRRSATNAERLLWQLLRARQIAGAKFRRQHQFGPYILDFYCHERKLAIEVNGAHHATEVERDEARTHYLESRGLRVIRFTNREALRETESLLNRVWDEVDGGSWSTNRTT